MPDRWYARVLARLLPSRTREWFLPAWFDARQMADGPRLILRTLLIYFDCWRLTLADLPNRLLDPAPRLSQTSKPGTGSMFLHQLRLAFRRLIREPGFTAAAVLTLALGVGANAAVFAVVEAVLLRPLPYEKPDELVILRHRDQRTGITKEFIAIGDWMDLASRQSVFQHLGAYGQGQATIYGDGEPYQVPALNATPEVLDALGFHPLLGRSLRPEDAVQGAGRVALLGHELWLSRFGGDSAIVGRTVRVGSLDRTVIGVAPPGFRFPPNAATGLILSQQMPAQAPAGRKSNWTFGLARLKPGKTLADADLELAALSRQMEAAYPQDNLGSAYYAQTVRDAMVGSTRTALRLMLAAVGVVLLIACANVANLLLARSLGRHREMAVRMTLGASRGGLVSQLMIESLALALLAGTAGAAVGHWGAKALVSLVPAQVNVPNLGAVGLNLPVLGFTLGVTVLTALLCGAVTAMTTPLASAAGVLVTAGRASMSPAARRATSTLVGVEIALAVILLVGAGLILRSFAGLLSVNPGFSVDRVLTLQIAIPQDRYNTVEAREGFYRRAFEALRASPGIEELGVAAVTPLTGNNWTAPFQRVDQPLPAGERPPEVGWQLASSGYFQTIDIPLKSGRLFNDSDRPGGPMVVLVSETVERRFFGGESAVGRHIRAGEGTAEIVGVVGDIRRAGLTDEPRADLYFPFEIIFPNPTTVFIRTAGEPLEQVGAVRAVLREVEANTVVMNPISMEQIARESVQVTRLVMWLLGVFALAALALAAVGIYGVMSYVVRQRTREIGTRIALGAGRVDILRMVVSQGAVIAASGVAAGLAVGLVAARVLRSLLFGVSPADPMVLAGATAVLAAATLLACYVPARRAASIDPARTLADQ